MKKPVSEFMPTAPSMKAVFAILIAVGLYALQDLLVKLLPKEISLVEIFFFRSLFGFIFIIPMILREKHPQPFKTQQPVWHLVRCVATLCSTLCFISAFRLMPLAEAYAITFSAPIFMSFFAILLLGEPSSYQRWLAVFLGFCGVLIMFRPGPPEANPGSLIALGGGIFHAISQLLTRKLTQKDSLSLVITSFTVLTFVVSGAMMPFYWQSYALETLLALTAIGILGCGAHFFMSWAFQLAPVSFIAPFDYAALLWGLLFDILIWGAFPDAFMICGVALVIFAGVYLVRKEQNRKIIVSLDS